VEGESGGREEWQSTSFVIANPVQWILAATPPDFCREQPALAEGPAHQRFYTAHRVAPVTAFALAEQPALWQSLGEGSSE